MLWRVFAIFQIITIFWSNYNLDFCSYGQLFVLVFFKFSKDRRKDRVVFLWDVEELTFLIKFDYKYSEIYFKYLSPYQFWSCKSNPKIHIS